MKRVSRDSTALHYVFLGQFSFTFFTIFCYRRAWLLFILLFCVVIQPQAVSEVNSNIALEEHIPLEMITATANDDVKVGEEHLPQAIVEAPDVAKLIVTLPLDKASMMLDKALSIAKAESMLPMTVVILDAGGHIVALKRQDGAGIFRVELANAKAYGALGMGVSTGIMGERLQNRPVFAGALTGISDGQWVGVPGGVLIRNDKAQVIGSVGISGDTSEKDEYVAINAIKAAGYYPEPLEANENWRGTHL
ncbi:heme-binding protein [uncultured Shewanella sp.]|uniref:GlcG/HbpS family heme-binding protein n=1 Tax=uncultured Shewanella sp. TaxID=173975 RepID=UPI0026123C0A|nr:heme-binding protein [uncultured Shewanella sp.]